MEWATAFGQEVGQCKWPATGLFDGASPAEPGQQLVAGQRRCMLRRCLAPLLCASGTRQRRRLRARRPQLRLPTAADH